MMFMIAPGAKATHYVGSDSYASVVKDVERFKSGARKGQIKAIVACHIDLAEDGTFTERPHMEWVKEGDDFVPVPKYDRFLPVVQGPCPYCSTPSSICWHCNHAGDVGYFERSSGRVAYWSKLVVGEAVDYRDPHF
jgi:hypothetical protein